MKIFEKISDSNNRVTFYLFGKKVLSYKKRSKYKKIYSKRFGRLSEKEQRFILEEQFKLFSGEDLNLDNPRTFNEKIQWLKLYYHNPLMTKCADKVGLREFICEKFGEEYLVKSYGVYKSPNEIKFDKLPEKFVIKVNWGSGQNIVVENKSRLNIPRAKKRLKKWLNYKNNHYYDFLEWCYKDIKPRILIEEFIEYKTTNIEYQVFCFNGKAKFILCELNGKTRPELWKRGIYDLEWNPTPFTIGEMGVSEVARPHTLDKIIELANTVAAPFPFVRVDMIDINGELKFREMTFYSGNGMSKFYPSETNLILGKELKLEGV